MNTPGTTAASSPPRAKAQNRSTDVTRYFPEGTSFNRFAFQIEQSIGTGHQMPCLMGFNAPNGLPINHARSLAVIISEAFKLAPEPDYVQFAAGGRPGILEQLNNQLPGKERVRFRDEKQRFNYDTVLTLADFGMLLGAQFVAGEPLIIVLGLTSPVCGLRNSIQLFLKQPIFNAITDYCKGQRIDPPSDVTFITQYQAFRVIRDAAETYGLTSPADNAFNHLDLWMSPEGVRKIELVLGRVSRVITNSRLSELIANMIALNVSLALNRRQAKEVRDTPLTHKKAAELFSISGRWRTEEYARYKINTSVDTPGFHTHAKPAN